MIQHTVNVSSGKDSSFLKVIESGQQFRAVFAVQHDLAGMPPDDTAKDEPDSVAKQLRCARRQPRDLVDQVDLATNFEQDSAA
ncbi:hypothetical protein [Xanthomonas vesicatoria]|uniref:hypothetical protein n=1 Tax=Xanthomonas vesicatoria TaxID=56460 RepID=UPI001E62C406|nr:hypothetical protein [Xanthomonas vesicatoria]MCC8619118.1 hypothetical protein [Xanthomonas vesicatoria]MCC8632831.1 hypothetical protein [Xanthomonas vesicatoria]